MLEPAHDLLRARRPRAPTEVSRAAWRFARLATTLAALASITGFADAALAQQPAQTKPATPDAGASWIRICSPITPQTPTPAPPGVKSSTPSCYLHHERLDGRSGRLLLSVDVRENAGTDRTSIVVLVPPGVQQKDGLRLYVLTREQWQDIRRGIPFDGASPVSITIPFTACNPIGCTAQGSLPPTMMQQLSGSAALAAVAIGVKGQKLAFHVLLENFARARVAAPVDSAAYGRMRRDLIEKLQKRGPSVPPVTPAPVAPPARRPPSPSQI